MASGRQMMQARPVWLGPEDAPEALPDPDSARLEPNGLLAVGGALTPPWLLHAYRHGIFPWFSEGEPILWWSPDPRAVLYPERFRVRRSLRQSARHRGYETRVDSAFQAVVDGCAAPRAHALGTWITDAMRRAYQTLHAQGHAHSVETWREGVLVGGLYGVRVGGVFCGESMFSVSPDASKVALWRLVAEAKLTGIELIDCQMPTPHLLSLGAECLPRGAFLRTLERLRERPGAPLGLATAPLV